MKNQPKKTLLVTALLLVLTLLLAACGESTVAPSAATNTSVAASTSTSASTTTVAASTTAATVATSTPVVIAIAAQTTATTVAATNTLTDINMTATVTPAAPTTTNATTTVAATAKAATTAVATTAPAANKTAATTQAVSSGKVPRFEAAATCPFTLPKGQTDGQTVKCGYAIVPELHSQPANGKTVKLPVAVFKSQSATPAPEPIVFLEGGPGGPIQSIIDLMEGDLLTAFAAKNDVILYDQRGAGLAQPSLACPEFLTQDLMDATTVLTSQESADHTITPAIKCHDRLVSQGINLSAYNSSESAADINDIRALLSYQKVILYGSSYGTLLAQTTMRLFPQIVKSTVLDSVVPPNFNVNIQGIATISRSFNLLFGACAADTTCNTKYPDLKNVFSKTVAALNAKPVTVQITDPNTNQKVDAKATGDKLISSMIILLYESDAYPLFPQFIYAISNGNYAILGPLLSIPLAEEKDISYGMYFSVECSEDWAFSTPNDAKAAEKDALPELAKDNDISVQANFTLCQKWNVKKADAAQHALIKSDIPTLVLEGQFDPVTPPAYGQAVAQNLSKSFYVEFPFQGHSQAVPGNACSLAILSGFFAHPTAKPDSTCTSQLSIKF